MTNLCVLLRVRVLKELAQSSIGERKQQKQDSRLDFLIPKRVSVSTSKLEMV
jgi:hypothetical protein